MSTAAVSFADEGTAGQDSLSKSYVSALDPNFTFKHELFHTLFAEAKKERREVELVNMDTGERTTNLSVLERAEEYAKGLITLNLTPNVDNIVVIGCATFDALAIFAAAAQVGVGFTHLFVHPPREERIVTPLDVLSPKVVIFGEGAGGHNASALLPLFDSDTPSPSSSRLPFVEHLFYDGSYKDRSPSHKCVKTLNNLRELGESVTEEKLADVRNNVKPDFICQHLLTSGSTGSPKCTSRSQGSLVKLASLDRRIRDPTIIMNMNVDTMASYVFLINALVGLAGRTVMLPETYEECPMKEQGKVLTEAIIAERVEHIILTMSALGAIMDYLKDNKISLPQPMKSVYYSGQIVSKQFIEDGQRLMKGLHAIGYGMTELIGIGSTPPGNSEEHERHIKEGILRPFPNTEVRLTDEQNEMVDIGKVGEIQVRSFLAIKEYRNDEAKTRNLFTEDGFVRTGDAGVMFPDGTFKVLGRMSNEERFKIFGKVEYPGPIEDILSLHPEISQVSAVSGKLNDWIGDEITACIMTKDRSKKISEEELFDFWKSKGMYERQRPARILYFEEFPSTENERKISTAKLRQQARDMIAEDESLGKCQWFINKEKSGKTY